MAGTGPLAPHPSPCPPSPCGVQFCAPRIEFCPLFLLTLLNPLFVLISSGFGLETGPYYIAQIDLKIMAVLLFQPPECWVYPCMHHAWILSFSALFIASDGTAELSMFL